MQFVACAFKHVQDAGNFILFWLIGRSAGNSPRLGQTCKTTEDDNAEDTHGAADQPVTYRFGIRLGERPFRSLRVCRGSGSGSCGCRGDGGGEQGRADLPGGGEASGCPGGHAATVSHKPGDLRRVAPGFKTEALTAYKSGSSTWQPEGRFTYAWHEERHLEPRPYGRARRWCGDY